MPESFGDWRVDTSLVPIQVSPDVQARLNRIYNQTLSRTYINSQGYRIMLSIAYGGDQSDSMQLHRPEACYPNQGFEIVKKLRGIIDLGGASLPVKRMVTRMGKTRPEPLTYWVVIGGEVTRGDTDRKWARLKVGLTGKVADGMLVRVSSIDADVDHAFNMQSRFVVDLGRALDTSGRERILGGAGGA